MAEGSISVLVGRDGEAPQTVFMSYESFVQVASRLYAAIDALNAAGLDACAALDENAV